MVFIKKRSTRRRGFFTARWAKFPHWLRHTALLVIGTFIFCRNFLTRTHHLRPGIESHCRNEFLAAPSGLGQTYNIHLFYHIGMIGGWKEIVREQMSVLETCGLGAMANKLTISYNNPTSNSAESTRQQLREILNDYPFASRLNLRTFIDAGTQPPYEKPIIEKISSMCRQSIDRSNKTNIAFYFHNKGSSKYSPSDGSPAYKTYTNIYYWRRYMEWFLLERPTLCIRAILNHGTKTCGVNLQKWPSMHYSGNFWAASCDYIKDLPFGNNIPISKTPWLKEDTTSWAKYVQAEMWIGNFTNRSVGEEIKHLTLFNIRTDLYNYPATPSVYSWVLSNRTFLQGKQISEYVNEIDVNQFHFFQTYEPGNQSHIWLDYLSGFGWASMISELLRNMY